MTAPSPLAECRTTGFDHSRATGECTAPKVPAPVSPLPGRELPAGTATSHQMQRERTLDFADLGALPRGRAVVFASGAPATLIETVPWMTGPHAAAVRASIAAHDPANELAALSPTTNVPAPVGTSVEPSEPDSGAQAWLNAAPRLEDDR